MARLAHTFGRVGRGALAVDSASVAFARAFAFVSVFRVRVVRWRANALARLDAALVGAALRVGDATHLAGSAEAFVRISGEVAGTLAIETAGPVETFGAETAGRLPVDSFLTFVDIFARSVGPGAETSWASAIADSAGDCDALGSGRAGLASSGAVGQQTGSSDDLVRRLASAFDAVADVAALERIAFVAVWAGTVVASGQVLTDGPVAASGFIGWRFETFVDIPAQSSGLVADPASGTDADATAGRRRVGRNADFSARTRILGAASRRSCGFLDTAGLVRLAFKSVGTFTDETARFVATDGPAGARLLSGRALVDVDTSAVGSSGKTGRAHAFGHVVDQHAFLIGRAADTFTRICNFAQSNYRVYRFLESFSPVGADFFPFHLRLQSLPTLGSGQRHSLVGSQTALPGQSSSMAQRKRETHLVRASGSGAVPSGQRHSCEPGLLTQMAPVPQTPGRWHSSISVGSAIKETIITISSEQTNCIAHTHKKSHNIFFQPSHSLETWQPQVLIGPLVIQFSQKKKTEEILLIPH